jgi:SAM-dependent methyltransferase
MSPGLQLVSSAGAVKFQEHYSRDFPAVKDEPCRKMKSQKIVQALQDHWQCARFDGRVALDLGCSVGVACQALSAAGARVWGIDIDQEAIFQIAPPLRKTASFAVADACAAPFRPGSFDIIICSQVYEHAPSVRLLAEEIYRLLKEEGVCFFSGPNRWAVMERHYHLPFLSWLPREWADYWVKKSKGAPGYYERPLSSARLRAVLSAFMIRDLTPDLIKEPKRYGLGSEVGKWRVLARWVPSLGWSLLGRLVPNFNWLLTKPRR